MIETKLNLLLEENGLVGQIKGIGIGAPNAKYSTGQIINPPNLVWDKGESLEKRTFEIVKILSEKMGCPAALDNDVNLAALGEKIYGNAKSMKDFIMIALGTGVGAGVFSNDALVRGNNCFAGELGHTVSVRHNGRLCGCGGRGHLEAYASATGVAQTAREFLEARADEESLLRGISEIESKHVYDAAMNGDKLAKDVFEFTGKILGEALANFVAFSDPEAIILFGGMAKSWEDCLEEPTRRHLEANLMPIFRGKVKLLLTGLQEADAAVLGASALAW